MEFAPNGSMIATGHQNQMIQFWDSDNNISQKYQYNVSSCVTQISFSRRREIMGTSDNLN